MKNGFIVRVGIVFDAILDLGMVIGSVSVFFLMVIVCYDVVARYFFNAPTIWVSEISSILLLFLPFLAGGWIMRKDGHVKMDLVLNMMEPRTKTVFNIAAILITALTSLILMYYGTKISAEIYKMNYRTDTVLRLPKWPLLSIIPLGFFLMFVQAMRKMYGYIFNKNSLEA